MTDKPRTFGLLLRSIVRYGTHYVEAMLCSKEQGDNKPLGCGDFLDRYKRPKHLQELELDGLGLQGFVTDSRDETGRCLFIGHDQPEYHDVFSVGALKAKRMLKALDRLNKALAKEHAFEPGDKLYCIAKTLKLDFMIEDRGDQFRHDPDRRWYVMTVADGRNRYRNMIEEARNTVTERMFPKPKLIEARAEAV